MAEHTLLMALLLPLLTAIGIALARHQPNIREGVTLTGAALLLINTLFLLGQMLGGATLTLTLVEVVPGLVLELKAEPLGVLFATVAATLWPLNSVYSIGYMRGNQEKQQTRFYLCFAVSIFAAMGIALAGNLLTLFFFYELLTLSTYPLVTHKGNEAALRSGRIYLGILLLTSIGLLLPAIAWTWSLTGSLDFRPGGLLHDTGISPTATAILLGLFMFGIGKAALMPFHLWLPAAMVAPTPVSALLHAVAVVKAGVFTVLKVVVYIFGVEHLAATGAANWLMWAAVFTLLSASLFALTRDNLKARLAYSTVSQLAYVVLGASLACWSGIFGGALQIAMHAMGKITLFFCAGAIYTAAHKSEISQMDGLGRRMPWTYAAFTLGALSIIGLPPLGGSWSKWFLMLGAAESGQWLAMMALMLSSLLGLAYLLPIILRGYLLPSPMEDAAIGEAPPACLIPLLCTAAGCLLLFVLADDLFVLLEDLREAGGTP